MLETTPARVAAPAVPAPAEEPIPDEDLGWTPADLPRAVRSRRTFRIPVILLALAAAAGVYAAARFAVRLPMAQAEAQRTTYAGALLAADDALPTLQEAAAAITDPAQDPGPYEAALARLEGTAAMLLEVSSQQPSAILPGLPADDLEALEPLRGRIAAIGIHLTTVTGLLHDTAAYRGALDDMFLLPDLPGEDEGPSVEVFSDRLSQMIAASVSSAALLPATEVFADHRAEVEDLLAWLPDWQAAYLDVLRDGDLDAAASLRAEASGRIAEVRDGLTGPLEAARAWVDDEIVRVERDVAAALVLAG